MISKKIKVGIVGAGTTGVYLSSLLHKRGYQVDLFEKAFSPRTHGCGILIVQDGINALSEGNLELAQKIIKRGTPVTHFEFRNLKNKVANINSVSYKEGDFLSVLIHRKIILETLLEYLPSNCLHTNAEFTSLEQKNNKVIVSFRDRSKWEGDILIGVDGIFSKVRQFVTPGKYLSYLGDLVWRGVVEDHDFCPEGNFLVYMRSRGIYANFFSVGKGKTHWGFFIEKQQTDLEKRRSRPDNILIPEIELAKLPDAPRKVIQRSSPEEMVCNFSYDLNQLPHIYNKRVLLMGDAAHAKSPTRARGMTAGFEDALTLAHHFENYSDIDEMLYHFQEERLPIVHEYQRSSREISQKIGRSRKHIQDHQQAA